MFVTHFARTFTTDSPHSVVRRAMRHTREMIIWEKATQRQDDHSEALISDPNVNDPD